MAHIIFNVDTKNKISNKKSKRKYRKPKKEKTLMEKVLGWTGFYK